MQSSFFGIISELIAQDKIQDAFEVFKHRNLPIGDIIIEITLLMNRWNENEQKTRLGVISHDDYGIERRKIIQALLVLAKNLTEDGGRYDEPPAIQISDSLFLQGLGFNSKANLEKIIGDSTLTPLTWFTKMVEASRSICRILVETPQGDTWSGTGFLTNGGYLFTNHHVLGSPEDVEYSTIEFNYLSEKSRRYPYKLNPKTWVGSEDLDFALVKVVDNPRSPLSQWGYLQIDIKTTIAVGDAVPIIQHPKGQSMQVSIEGNFVKRISQDGLFIYYTTDTMAGSSGSPVFNKDWKVIAIHHAGIDSENLNRGVLFNKIINFFEYLPPVVFASDPAFSKSYSPLRLFWMYDIRDNEYSEALKEFFSFLLSSGRLVIYDMHLDVGGEDIEEALDLELGKADIVICTITRRFLSSTVRWAEKAREKGKKIVPVLISPVTISGSFFERLVTLPSNPKFATDWNNLDSAYLNIFQGIERILERIYRE